MPANNDSSCAQTWYTDGKNKKLVLDVVMDSGDGSFASVVLPSNKIDGFLWKLETNPDTPAPDDDYDITLTDALGTDVLNSQGINRHTTTTQVVYLDVATKNTSYVHPMIAKTDVLTLAISGNNTVSAKIKIALYWSIRP